MKTDLKPGKNFLQNSLLNQKNGKKHKVTQIQLYKDGKVWREISNAVDAVTKPS